jgi:hypothetical protein
VNGDEKRRRWRIAGASWLPVEKFVHTLVVDEQVAPPR